MTLQDSVDAWHESATRVVALLRALPHDAWNHDTDCPGWSVHDVVAHLAAIESELAGGPRPPADADASDVSPDYTQRGVEERAGVPPGVLVDELEQSVTARHELLRDLDVDGDAVPDLTPADVGWSWARLLSNRVVDVWVHEQDIREAVGTPGGEEGDAAAHTVAVFSAALPYVLGKVVTPPAGTTVRWHVTGPHGFDLTARMGEDGRARVVDDLDAPTVRLDMTQRGFTRLITGRRTATALGLTADGDTVLGHRILEEMPIEL